MILIQLIHRKYLQFSNSFLCPFQISIDDSNVPDVKYEVSAVSCLQDAYGLFPKNVDKRMESFLELYQKQYSTTTWSVADDCVVLYLPTDYISIRLKVAEGAQTEFVKIFSSNSNAPSTTGVPPRTSKSFMLF